MFESSRSLHFSLCFALVIACGWTDAEPDVIIGPTRVYVHEGASAWPDLDEVLWRAWNFTARIYGAAKADKIFTTRIQIIPPYQPITNGRDNWPSAVGAYYPSMNTIAVQSGAASVLDSSLLHEIMAHRLPHVIVGDANPRHDLCWTDTSTETCARDLELRALEAATIPVPRGAD